MHVPTMSKRKNYLLHIVDNGTGVGPWTISVQGTSAADARRRWNKATGNKYKRLIKKVVPQWTH